MHEGTLALAQVEANGIRIDESRLDKTIDKVGKRITALTERLRDDKVWGIWRRRYGSKASLGSRPQLSKVLHEDLGYKSHATTETGRAKMDGEALEQVDLPFVKKYLEIEKLKKLRSTYLLGVKRELVDGYLHQINNLNLARTHRSSNDHPNFQNFPIRDKLISKLVRSCFVPRDGHVLVETDYGGHEFRVAACFWADSQMIAYASDPSKDIHRDIAAECFLCKTSQVSKQMRFYAKNQFVFPTLYGSYYVSCTRNLWKYVPELELADGTALHEWLFKKRVKMMGRCVSRERPRPRTYEAVVKQVEKNFMERFPQFADRREQWWDDYCRRGWFRMMTGFVVGGVMSRNAVFNYPVQGPAFHCLLWALIRLQKWLVDNKMKSRVVGQIHDSIVGDVHKRELPDYVAMARRLMMDEIRKAWSWIIVPLEVEVEVAETNWFEKHKYEEN